MNFDLNKNSQRIIADLQELATLTSDENGAQRVAWTPIWEEARNWFLEKIKPHTTDIFKDSAGNMWFKLQGKSDKSIIIGSHLDSVPNGGWLDGALGVISGLEVLRHFSEAQIVPQHSIYIVDWADEEGARYGYSCLGSSAASGSVNISEFTNRVDNEGIPFKMAISKHGLNIDTFTDAHKTFQNKINELIAYLEFHIEQGPVLEQSNKNVAAVYGTAGVERYYIDFSGQSAHAGSFPTKIRQDAFLAAATSSLKFRDLALKYNAVCTVGEVNVTPGVVTIVPGQCTISIDMRSINKDDLAAMLSEAQNISQTSAQQFDCTVSWRKIYSVSPQIFDSNLVDICKTAVAEEIGESNQMYSGPLHDAVEMNKLIPTVMMFVMSKNGISHDKDEDTPINQLTTGIRAYLRLIDKVLN
ncbi:hydantoinase/carbamoylase family amidase [Staphylococcus gallinarum]|uniref:hydantoinase/carbamoylase family amidase n=1 Tax=Staphylococcus gallinarum TaxID=1293 RepID=UPI001E59954B|nr:hydantoinase/carbamoylase family amidase [Staphylococcus gallinarum]MCD8785516.1 hydantoinase/carbamoylase family amidase [Staphylococcus gallinarum]MCD8858220.1 hydantoinase/carbamoylase family amidase [Staphylococcus gallinarum]